MSPAFDQFNSQSRLLRMFTRTQHACLPLNCCNNSIDPMSEHDIIVLGGSCHVIAACSDGTVIKRRKADARALCMIKTQDFVTQDCESGDLVSEPACL